jgi:hypothetical protein
MSVSPLPDDANAADITLAAAREYLACGFSIIPLDSNPKGDLRKTPHPLFLPGKRWEVYQKRLPTEAEVSQWFSTNVRGGVPGIGIICGPVSGYLVTLDIDDGEFSVWLETHLTDKLLSLTWTVRSGGGYIHIRFFSEVPVFSGDFTAGGKKRGDIRADGKGDKGPGYVAAPPTLHPSNVRYITLYGTPHTVARVKDGNVLLRQLSDLFSGEFYSENLEGKGNKSILPPLDALATQELVQRLASFPNPKIKRAILRGATAMVGDWKGEDDNSFIDYWVFMSLLENGWTPEDIHGIYRSLPIGEKTYRNPSRSNHGESYFAVTLASAQQGIQRQKSALTVAKGSNFEVTKAVHENYDGDPVYALSIKWQDGLGSLVRVSKTDFDNDRSFMNAVWGQTTRVPEFAVNQLGRGFFNFKGAVGAMAISEEVPEDATVAGHIRSIMLRTLKTELRSQMPESSENFSLGWVVPGEEWAYVRGPVLIARVQALIHSAKPDAIWKVLRGLGGRSVETPIGTSTELVWIVPAYLLH